MHATKLLLAGFVAIASASSMHSDDSYFAKVLKRQAPGTPSYNCHDNCGTAISLSRQPNACDNQGFKTNYANCLQCAGPDNYNIWRMYGRTLSTAGSSCGLPTEPLPGKQSDVGPAVHDGGASSTAASATPASATAASTSVSQTVMPSTSQPVVQSSITGAPTASGNATGSFTSSAPLQQSTNGGACVGPAGILGAVVAGAMVVL